MGIGFAARDLMYWAIESGTSLLVLVLVFGSEAVTMFESLLFVIGNGKVGVVVVLFLLFCLETDVYSFSLLVKPLSKLRCRQAMLTGLTLLAGRSRRENIP